MSEKPNVLSGTQLLPTLVALVVLGGVLWVEKPLQSKRSPERDEPSLFRRADESAPARLWEDPFETVSRHLLGTQDLLEAHSSEFRSYYCNLLSQVRIRHPELPVQQASDFEAALASCEARKPRRYRSKAATMNGESSTKPTGQLLADPQRLAEIQGLGSLAGRARAQARARWRKLKRF